MIWKTPSDLGIIADGTYFELPLVVDSDEPVYFSPLAGQFPPGVYVTDTGVLKGTSDLLSDSVLETNKTFRFSIRATDAQGKIKDKTFSLRVSGVQPPTIQSDTTFLGSYYDSSYFKYQFLANDENDGSVLTWRVVRGNIPPGLTLSKSGLMEGFLLQQKVDLEAFSKIGWDRLAWDKFIYDFIRRDMNIGYEFTLELSDGINYSRKNYVIKVLAKDLLSSDRTPPTADGSEFTGDGSNIHLPFITTMPGKLPEIKPDLARQDTYFAFKFDAIDYDGDEVYYEITSPDEKGFDQYGKEGFDTTELDGSDYPMPKYIGLNNQTGWYTGQIAEQLEHKKDYQVVIYARKANNENAQGIRSTFIVSVLGQVDENITWITDSNLGSIGNGEMSILKVEATNTSGAPIEYYLKGDGGRTPQGVILLKNGMLSGRVSFDHIRLDNGITTFDNKTTSYDRVYTFTVVARSVDNSAYAEKTFKLQVDIVNEKPYENLYFKGFPNRDQRMLFESIMSRQDLFPDQLIYRADDPNYGKAKELRFLMLPGVEPADLPTYIRALSRNHHTKTVLFGNIKTAVALDEFYNVQYEVVYLDVVDEAEGKDPVTGLPAPAAQTIDLTRNKNAYIDKDGVAYTELTPNGLGNMTRRIASQIGIANPNSLPAWMTSVQPDYDNPGQFKNPIGFVRGIVLAYTVPGASNLIAYRLKNANFSFNRIPFKTDRYMLDDFLTRNYDLDLEKFIPGTETTIDRAPSIAEYYRNLGTVDYVIEAPFEEINGKTQGYIRINRVLDGAETFADGETLIFAQQDQFPADVPGYFDYISRGVENQRSAVWKINIGDDNIVTLTIERETRPGDIVTATKGTKYPGVTLNFEAYSIHRAYPLWWPFNRTLIDDPLYPESTITPHKETTFDQRGTRFFSYRDQYADIEAEAKYIKFPKDGVFL